MRACPWCAEQIQDEARVCRFCGRNASPDAPPPLLDQKGHYDVPLRLERQSLGSGSGGGSGFSSSSSGIAIKGSVCPQCNSANYVQTFSVWHGVLAVFLFPIGLLALLFPIRKCAQCGNQYGSGREIVRVLRVIAIFWMVLIALFILGIAGLLQSYG